MAVTNLDNGVNNTTVFNRPAGVVSVLATQDTETVRAGRFEALSGTGAAVAASGLLMGSGTTANPNTTAVADAKFLEFRCQSTATSGDNRLFYGRYALDGAGGGGECVRGLTVLGAANGTAHGGHFGMTVSDTGYVTGLGAGVRGTLELADAAIHANGTYYGGLIEIYSDGTTSSLAAVTKHAVLGIAASGDATGAATVLNALSVDGVTAADTTKMISSVSLAELPANTKGIAVLINGVRHYIPAVIVAEWN